MTTPEPSGGTACRISAIPVITSGVGKNHSGLIVRPEASGAEPAERLPEVTGIWVAGVADLQRGPDRGRDRLGDHEVHLRGEGGQHVGRVAPPLVALASGKIGQREVPEQSIHLTDANHQVPRRLRSGTCPPWA